MDIPSGDFKRNPLGGFSLGNEPAAPQSVPPPPPPPSMEIVPPEPVATPQGSPASGTPAPDIKTTLPPPPPSIAVRTFPSDTASLQASGGAAPRSEPIKLDADENIPVFQPETANQIPGGLAAVSPSRSGNKIFYITLGVILAVGLGFLGYYFVYPRFFISSPAEELLPPPAETPIVEAPADIIPAVAHQSLFINPPAVQASVNLSELSALEIISKLQSESLPAAPKTLKELTFLFKGNPVAFSEFLPVMAPDFKPEEIKAIVEDDFTSFLFYDDRGVWPGYVAKLRPETLPVNAQTTFAKLEGSEIRLFYTEEPGIHEEFKTGPVKGAPVRYAAFSKSGASFNYGIIGEYLLISTSFDGFAEALKYLGL